jgi:hypothetical protein
VNDLEPLLDDVLVAQLGDAVVNYADRTPDAETLLDDACTAWLQTRRQQGLIA